MPELHGQNAVLVCHRGRVEGILLRDHDTVRLHRPWLVTAGLPDPGYDVKPGSPNSLWAASPEELLGWFQTLALQVSLQAIGRALVRAYGVEEDRVWRRLADVVRAARSGVDLPPAAAELTDRQLFHAAGWPTKLVLGPLLARVGTGGGSSGPARGRRTRQRQRRAARRRSGRLLGVRSRQRGQDPPVPGTAPGHRDGRSVARPQPVPGRRAGRAPRSSAPPGGQGVERLQRRRSRPLRPRAGGGLPAPLAGHRSRAGGGGAARHGPLPRSAAGPGRRGRRP